MSNDYDPELVDGIMRRAVLGEWRQLLNRKALNWRGLCTLRGRLDPESGEFLPHPDVEDLRLRVDVAMADTLGCDLADLPGRCLDHVPAEWTTG